MLKPETAKDLQATLRGYEAARSRFSGAANEQLIQETAESYLVANRRFKVSRERAETELRKSAESGAAED